MMKNKLLNYYGKNIMHKPVTFKNIIIIFFILLLTGFSVGCMSAAHRAHTAALSTDPAVRSSAITRELKHQGVQVIEVGETEAIIIPSDLLFHGLSADLNCHYCYSLNLIVDFLRLYPKTFVEVAGYTDFSRGRDKDQLLSSQQAAQVAHYLWSKGIDARMVNAVGYGSERPVVNSDFIGGDAKNRRIEIYFQYN